MKQVEVGVMKPAWVPTSFFFSIRLSRLAVVLFSPLAALQVAHAFQAAISDSQQAQKASVAAPVFSPVPKTYTQPIAVKITCSTPGSTIHYALHGDLPSRYSTKYTGPIKIMEGKETIKAIAVKKGYASSPIVTANYIVDLPQAQAPIFTPPQGPYTSIQKVAISDRTPGATIYYTTNGEGPTTHSAKYTGEIRVDRREAIEAMATAPNHKQSDVAVANYNVVLTTAIPAFNPPGGIYSTAQTVSIGDATPLAVIRYTRNGKEPNSASPQYDGPILLSESTKLQTLKAFAVAPNDKPSAVSSASYTITSLVATPTFYPPAGTYTDQQSVTISDTTLKSELYYTTNGKEPTKASTRYTAPIEVSRSETLKAIAVVSGSDVSDVGSAKYVISQNGTAAPAISVIPALNGAVVISLASTTQGATVYYTIDGSTPTRSSTVYEAPFLVDSKLTVSAIAVSQSDGSSAVASQSFTQEIPSGTLVWSDEFSNSTGQIAQPNPSIWTYDTGTNGFGNDELEDYCAWGSKASPCDPANPNAYVGTDGYLHIVARNPVPGTPAAGNYTSARLKTQGLFSFRYGRIEFRARVPEAQGFWPAAWLLGNNIATLGWPACGEQDDLERVNAATSPDWNEGSVHGTGFTGGNIGTRYNFPAGENASSWHTYGMIWKEGQISYYIDDPAHPYANFTPASVSGFPGAAWPFDSQQSNFIILNLAVGGSWPGSPDSTTPFPSEFVIDYVRIYAN